MRKKDKLYPIAILSDEIEGPKKTNYHTRKKKGNTDATP